MADNKKWSEKELITSATNSLEFCVLEGNPKNNKRIGISNLLTKTNIGLSDVDNTSDLNKPLSTAAIAALGNRATVINPTFYGDFTVFNAQDFNTILRIDENGSIYLNEDGGNTFAKTQSSTDNSNKVATTAFVKNAFNTQFLFTYPIFTGEATFNYSTPAGNENSDVIFQIYNTATDDRIFQFNDYGNLQHSRNAYFIGNQFEANNPTFTGTVIAPTPIISDNSTKVATTAFVKSVIDGINAGTGSDFKTGEILNVPINTYELYESGIFYITSQTPLNGEIEFKLENIFADFQGGIYQKLTSKKGRVYNRFFRIDESEFTPFIPEPILIVGFENSELLNNDEWASLASGTKFTKINGQYVEF